MYGIEFISYFSKSGSSLKCESACGEIIELDLNVREPLLHEASDSPNVVFTRRRAVYFLYFRSDQINKFIKY